MAVKNPARKSESREADVTRPLDRPLVVRTASTKCPSVAVSSRLQGLQRDDIQNGPTIGYIPVDTEGTKRT